jgi:methyltransferase
VKNVHAVFYAVFIIAAVLLRFLIRKRTLNALKPHGTVTGKWTTRYIFYAYLFLFCGSISEYFILNRLPDWGVSALGLFLYVTGILGRQWAHRSLGPWWSVDIEVRKGQKIIEQGPYSRIRHPNNLAHLLETAGLILIPNSWYTLVLFFAAYVPVIILRSVLEEKLMIKTHVKTYKKYRERTGAFLPRIFFIKTNDRTQSWRMHL